MPRIKQSFLKRGYTSKKFNIVKTNHLIISLKINGKKGYFIIDTGASNTCVCKKMQDYFNLQLACDEKIMATGASNRQFNASQSQNNTLKIKKFKSDKQTIVLFDLSHINEAFKKENIKPIQGILGADILLQQKAVIDYYNKRLFIKKFFSPKAL